MTNDVVSHKFRSTKGKLATAGLLLFIVGCASPRRGILIMAHGGDAAWNRQVEAVVEPLRAKYSTEIAFGMAKTSSIREAVHKLEEKGVREIAVVRLFVSGDSFRPATEYILGLRPKPPTDPMASSGTEGAAHRPSGTVAVSTFGGRFDAGNSEARACIAHEADDSGSHHAGHHMEPPEPIKRNSRFILSDEGVGDSPLVDEILMDRVGALSSDAQRESVLILAHGPADDAENERWLASMNARVQQLRRLGPFQQIRCETLREDWPVRREEAERRIRQFVEEAGQDGGRCIVVPFRVAGFGPYRDVLAGLNYVADGRGFCPHPNMTRWIETTAIQCLAEDNILR